MRSLPIPAQLYLYAIWLAAAVGVAITLVNQPAQLEIWLLLLGSAGYVLADYFEVDFIGREGSHTVMTLADIPTFFFIATFGFHGILPLILGSVITDLLNRRTWYRVLFNVSSRSLNYLILTLAFTLVVSDTQTAFYGLKGITLLASLAVIYYVLNTLFVSTIIALASRQQLLSVYRESFRLVQWVHFISIPYGMILSVIWYIDRWLVLPALVPMIMTHRALRAIAGWQEESRRSAQLATEAQQLNQTLEQLQHRTTALVRAKSSQATLAQASDDLAQLLNADAHWVILTTRATPILVHAVGTLDLAAETLHSTLPTPTEQAVQVWTAAELEGTGLSLPAAWQSLVAIPLVLDGRQRGAMWFGLSRQAVFSSADQRVFFAFAAHAVLEADRLQQTEALQQKQQELLQSSKLAVLGTFASGIAHEFNNLLAGVLGYAQLGKMSDSVGEKDEVLGLIERSSLRGGSITRGLLTFARREHGQRSLNNLATIINDTVQLIERDFAKQQISIKVSINTPVTSTMCDGGQIAQVLLNVLTNARDAMVNTNGGMINVALNQVDDQFEISVADTGSGIPADLIEQIFQPFVTTKGSHGSGEQTGTGLGLSICYGIMESHGGSIQLASTVGQGTTVTLRLPHSAMLADDPEIEPNQPQLLLSRVLIIDDDRSVGVPFARLLEHHGYRVELVERAREGLERYQQQRFDIVCCDVNMPGMNGSQFAQALFAYDPQAHLIIITGNQNASLLAQLRALPIVGILDKPFSVEQLIAMMNSVRPTIVEKERTAAIA